MKKKTFEDLDLEIEQLGFEKDALLRKAGWDQTSHTPGCLWLWKRKIGSETYLVNQSAAIAITLWLEEFGEREKES
jgi:hypothetical protein